MPPAMEFGVVLPQVGGDWERIKRFALLAEDGGLDSVWVVDHLIGFPPQAGIHEAWTIMSALAGVTERVGIGAQVLCQSFRNPALLAKMATTLDLVSGGRLRLLLGAGWLEAEYQAFGYPFPTAGQRVAELEDTIRICRGMFDAQGRAFTHDGQHHRVDEVMNVPPPERRIPVGVGGTGPRMLDLIARLADEWNTPAMALPRYAELRTAVDERLAAQGRQLRRSTQIVFSPGDRTVPDGLQMFKPDHGLRGSRDQMVDRVGELAALGIQGLYGFVAGEAALEDLAASLPELRAAAS